MYIYTYIHTCTHTCTCIHPSIHPYIHTCTYLYILVHTYIHTYLYMGNPSKDDVHYWRLITHDKLQRFCGTGDASKTWGWTSCTSRTMLPQNATNRTRSRENQQILGTKCVKPWEPGNLQFACMNAFTLSRMDCLMSQKIGLDCRRLYMFAFQFFLFPGWISQFLVVPLFFLLGDQHIFLFGSKSTNWVFVV